MTPIIERAAQLDAIAQLAKAIEYETLGFPEAQHGLEYEVSDQQIIATYKQLGQVSISCRIPLGHLDVNKLGLLATDDADQIVLARQSTINSQRTDPDSGIPFSENHVGDRALPDFVVSFGSKQRRYFVVATEPSDTKADTQDTDTQNLADEDISQATHEIERAKSWAEIASRPGQIEFSKDLRRIYEGVCAISGCMTPESLEAAHIRTQPGIDDNSRSNGVLLRADIHALFDAYLITLSANGRSVEACSTLVDPGYQFLNQAVVKLPLARNDAPSADNIRWHRERFAEAVRKRRVDNQ